MARRAAEARGEALIEAVCRQGPDPADGVLQVLAREVFHHDELGRAVLAQVEHPADISVGDLPGQLELVLKPRGAAHFPQKVVSSGFSK
jgi:hypothetical protein